MPAFSARQHEVIAQTIDATIAVGSGRLSFIPCGKVTLWTVMVCAETARIALS